MVTRGRTSARAQSAEVKGTEDESEDESEEDESEEESEDESELESEDESEDESEEESEDESEDETNNELTAAFRLHASHEGFILWIFKLVSEGKCRCSGRLVSIMVCDLMHKSSCIVLMEGSVMGSWSAPCWSRWSSSSWFGCTAAAKATSSSGPFKLKIKPSVCN